jgi:hypothetical protein
MAGGIQPDTIKKNIEWAKALYEFTDYVSISDIKQGAIDEPGYLADWILSGDYPNLSRFIRKELVIPRALPERTV